MNCTPLLALDPALPQRDLLLDETLMAEYLSHLIAYYGDVGIRDCERLRTKYRVGTSLRVLYEVKGNGQSYRIAARALPRCRRVALPKRSNSIVLLLDTVSTTCGSGWVRSRQHTLNATHPPATAGGTDCAQHKSRTFWAKSRRVANRFTSPIEVTAPELNTVFWIFPHDRKIKNLSLLANIPDELAQIDGRTWTRSSIVAHAPEKSVTAQCLDDKNQIIAYAKLYAGDEGRAIFKTYNHVAKAGNIRIPRAIAYFEEHHLLLLEPVAGVKLSAVTPTQQANAFFQLGKELRKLHGIKAPASTPRSTRLTPEALTEATATISQARPDVAVVVHRLSTKLIAQYEHGKHVFLHGDVHPKNLLLNDDQLFLLDLDQAATGPAEVDLGSVIAGLYCDACTNARAHRETSSLIHALLTGYGASQNSHALRWHVAAALLQERALRAITRVRTTTLQKLPELLLTAETVLNGGVSEN